MRRAVTEMLQRDAEILRRTRTGTGTGMMRQGRSSVSAKGAAIMTVPIPVPDPVINAYGLKLSVGAVTGVASDVTLTFSESIVPAVSCAVI